MASARWAAPMVVLLFGCRFELDSFAVAPGDDSSIDAATDSKDDATNDDTSFDADVGTSDAPPSCLPPPTGPDGGPPAPVVACTPASDGSVCVPASTFSLGAVNATTCPPSGCASEKPIIVSVQQFDLDRDEVTVGAFRTWWNAGHVAPKKQDVVFTNAKQSLKWGSSPSPVEPTLGGACTWLGASIATNDGSPINCVAWSTALAFCMSEGKRLPTEAEWELEASGGEDRLFPWSSALTEGCAFGATDVTCAMASSENACGAPGAAPTIWTSKHGAHDLAGDLGEWVLDAFTSGGYPPFVPTADPFEDVGGANTLRVVRGGSFLSPAQDVRAAARMGRDPTTSDASTGFRCVVRP